MIVRVFSLATWSDGVMGYLSGGFQCLITAIFICSSFKLFLELEPQVRDIIFKFYESKYASCLKMLDEMKVSCRKAEQTLKVPFA